MGEKGVFAQLDDERYSVSTYWRKKGKGGKRETISFPRGGGVSCRDKREKEEPFR